MKAARTSAPTSNASCPIAGPNHAINLCGATSIALTVASITPAANPFQPACTAPTTVPASSHSNTGRQYAGIGLNVATRGIRIGNDGAMHLFQPHRLTRQKRFQQLAIARNGLRAVADMQTQVKCVVGCRADAALAC